MKKLLIIAIILSSLVGCLSEKEKRKNDIEVLIYQALEMKAKILLNYPESFVFDRMNTCVLNDSVTIYTMKYSAQNAFGVNETFVMGDYFNTNTGDYLTDTEAHILDHPLRK